MLCCAGLSFCLGDHFLVYHGEYFSLSLFLHQRRSLDAYCFAFVLKGYTAKAFLLLGGVMLDFLVRCFPASMNGYVMFLSRASFFPL